MPRRALEQQVFEQVRHAGFAVALVPAADAVGQVDRRRRLRVVGRQQHLQAVGQAVFGDALHRGDGFRRCDCDAGGEHKEQQKEAKPAQQHGGFIAGRQAAYRTEAVRRLRPALPSSHRWWLLKQDLAAFQHRPISSLQDQSLR